MPSAFAVFVAALVISTLLIGGVTWAAQAGAFKRPPAPNNGKAANPSATEIARRKRAAEEARRRAQRPSRVQKSPASAGAMIPQRSRLAMPSDGRFLPADIPVRSTEGVTGFNNASGTTRVQVGGPNGNNVQEKIVNVTLEPQANDLTPFYSTDELYLFYASNRAATGGGATSRYRIFRTEANPTNGAANAFPFTDPADNQYDYLFPAINGAGNQIAFIRSDANDTQPVTNPDGTLNQNKVWRLYVSDLPTVNQLAPVYISTTPNSGGTNLRSLTLGANGQPLSFAGRTIVNVGRPAWIGGADIAFAGKLSDDPNYHIFTVNVLTGTVFQLTSGPADERNPAVTPDGRTIAFDSNAVAFYNAAVDLANQGYTPGAPRSASSPAATPTSAKGLNPSGKRNIFTMGLSGENPAQFTGKYAGAPDLNNEQPAWSVQNIEVRATLNSNGNTLYLAFASTRQATFSPTDTTGTIITGYTDTGGTRDIYYARASSALNPSSVAIIGTEGALGSTTRAVRLDTADPSSDASGGTAKFLYDDQYPTWAPFIRAQRIGFQSDRTGTYAVNQFPAQGFVKTPSLNDLFVATVVDITAPTLIRYRTDSATGEIVHINKTSATSPAYDANSVVRTRDDGILPGDTLFFTVRVEDREAGLRPDKAVYIALKNPNGKYQSQAQGGGGVEHKEYFFGQGELAFGFAENNAAGQPVPAPISKNGINMGVEFEAETIGIVNGVAGSNYIRHRNNTQGGGVLYLGGIDDRTAFAGGVLPPFDSGPNSCWLELKPLTTTNPATGAVTPVTSPGGGGGVLYGAALRIPQEASDWYIDVIAYDNAVNPFNPNQTSNFIIYDNVWGFSTALPISPQASDILVVSDYTLGQKFFNSRFSNDAPAANVLPLFWGSESYLTDRDRNQFPASGDPAPFAPGSTTARFWDGGGPFRVTPTSPPNAAGLGGPTIPNALGVGSYTDEYLLSGTTNVDNAALAPTARYSIWRILSRGPVTTALLQAYLPQKTTRPADIRVLNPITGQPVEQGPQPILHSTRGVLWSSPFSGNLFVGPGTISDLQTQNDLTNFVNNGGRLLLTGQDIAFALDGNGQTNNFLRQTLGASYAGDDANAFTISAGTDSVVASDALFFTGTQSAYGETSNGGTWGYTAVNDDPLFIMNQRPGVTGDHRGDGARTSRVLSARNDFVTATGSGVAEFNYATGGGAVISNILNAGTQQEGRTVYFALGLESISHDFYTYTNPGGTAFIASRGRRTELMFNITSGFFRTGTITGQLIDTNGSPIQGALVRAVTSVAAEPNAAAGTAITDGGGNFQIVGLTPGAYVIYGYRPGFYTQHTAGTTVHGGWRNSINLVLKGANPGAVGGSPISGGPAGNQGGVFRRDRVTPIPSNAGEKRIEVQARRIEPNGTLTMITALTSDGTDVVNGVTIPRGAYRFPSLPIGEYEIIANAPDFVDNTTGQLRPGNPNYNPLFSTEKVTSTPGPGFEVLPDSTGTVTPVINDRVTVKENATLNINFFLQAAPQRVTGRVVEEGTNNGIGGAIVTARLQGTTTDFATATTNPDGTYQLTVLAPGQGADAALLPAGVYELSATVPGYVQVNVNPLPTVTVGGDSTVVVVAPDIIMRKLPPGAVSGLVRISNGTSATTSGVAGATVSLYVVTTVNGVDQQAATPRYSYTLKASDETPRNDGTGYLFNWRIPEAGFGVDPGRYNAYVTKPGFVGDPSPFANVIVVEGAETKNINFTLNPPKVYGGGIQLISTPFDYSNDPAVDIFNLRVDGDNNGNGVPNELSDNSIFSQFNVADWTGTTYNISPDIRLRPGKGYFVRFGAVTSVVLNRPGITTSSFTLNLNNGWNLIGNPFAVFNQGDPNNPNDDSFTPAPDVDLSDGATVKYSYTINGLQRNDVPLAQAVTDGAVQSVAYSYTGSLSGSTYVQTAILRPWLGYWFRAFVPIQMRLINTTGRSVKATTLRAGGDGKFRTVSRAERDSTSFRAITSKGTADWRLQLAVRQVTQNGEVRDVDNSIGVSPDAKDGFDNKYDNEKPPKMTEAESVYLSIKGSGAEGRATTFTDQIQAAYSGTKTWEFTVQSAGSGEVTVYWPNINRLPRGVDPVLVDVATGRRVSMRSGGSSFRFTPGGRAEQTFRIEVAPPVSQPFDLLNLRSQKGLTRGGGYRFTFITTKEANVSAEIKTLTGKTIRRMQTRAKSGIETTVVWDGRDQEGSQIPAGPYVLDLIANDDKGAQVRRQVMLTNIR